MTEGQNTPQTMEEALEQLKSYKEFYATMEPIAEKINADQKLANYIYGESKELDEVKKPEDLATVTVPATTEVKGMTADEIKELIATSTQGMIDNFIKSKKEEETEKEFEARTRNFIANTPDFESKADAIAKYIDDYNIKGVEVAYMAVTGIRAMEEAHNNGYIQASEEMKKYFSNSAAPEGTNTAKIETEDSFDKFIGRNASGLW